MRVEGIGHQATGYVRAAHSQHPAAEDMNEKQDGTLRIDAFTAEHKYPWEPGIVQIVGKAYSKSLESHATMFNRMHPIWRNPLFHEIQCLVHPIPVQTLS